MTTTTNDAALAAALRGFGVTRLLSYQVAAELANGSLRQVLVGFEPAPLPVQVVHRDGRRASAKVRAFVDLAVERLRAIPSL
jgi:DNA-binding transcriptional LysR family regulator